MKRRLVLTAAMVLLSAASALADPIEGNWKTQNGETAGVVGCGGSFCITMKTGKHKGKSVGKVAADGNGKYTGSVTDPATDKTYVGGASLSGGSMRMSGCVLGGLICKRQTWKKM